MKKIYENGVLVEEVREGQTYQSSTLNLATLKFYWEIQGLEMEKEFQKLEHGIRKLIKNNNETRRIIYFRSH